MISSVLTAEKRLQQMDDISGPRIENRAMFEPDVLHHYFRISSKVNLQRTTVSRGKFERSFRVIWALLPRVILR